MNRQTIPDGQDIALHILTLEKHGYKRFTFKVIANAVIVRAFK